jgi:hypothetical protein
VARTQTTGEPAEGTFVASSDARAASHPMADRAYQPPAPDDQPGERAPRRSRMTLRSHFAGLVADFNAAPPRWRQLAFATIAAVAVLAALGGIHAFTGELGHFQVSGEIEDGLYVPVLFSWAVLLTAGLAAGLRSRWGLTRAEQAAWLGVAVLFTVMSFDELLMIHERIEGRVGVDWQLLYLPLVAAGGVAWIAVLTRMRRWSLEQVMWIAGAALWCVSQVFEKLEFTGDDVQVNGYKALDGIEKVLQFTGSSLFMLVGLLAIAKIVYSGDSPNSA